MRESLVGATTGRTFAIGDIHGDLAALTTLLGRLPPLDDDDALVFLGDYVDRGPDSAGVVALVRALPSRTPAQVVTLRGNHEDAWLKVVDEGWPGFVLPRSNGCRAAVKSFVPQATDIDAAELLLSGDFLPTDVVAWMRDLPHWHEDEFAIYVHAGLPEVDGRWLHPADAADPQVLLWTRTRAFFHEYKGKAVVVGHTVTNTLPPELSQYTPEDPDDLFWAGGSTYAIDTGAGKDGFLTALELPSGRVYESR